MPFARAHPANETKNQASRVQCLTSGSRFVNSLNALHRVGWLRTVIRTHWRRCRRNAGRSAHNEWIFLGDLKGISGGLGSRFRGNAMHRIAPHTRPLCGRTQFPCVLSKLATMLGNGGESRGGKPKGPATWIETQIILYNHTDHAMQ
jgi:hypothetical protein